MVPRRRRWVRLIALAALAAVACLAAWYHHATQPAQLRARLARQLSGLGNLRVDAADLAFSLTDGLLLSDFTISAAPQTDSPAPPADDPDAELVRAARVRIRYDGWLLLFGRFRATDIEADGVRVQVVRDRDTGRLNWPISSGPASNGRAFDPDDLAPLRARGVDLNILAIAAGRRRILKRSVCDLSARPGPNSYRVAITHPGGPARETAALDWDWIRHELRVDFDWLDIDVAANLVPVEWARQVERIGLAARVRAHGLRLRGTQPVHGGLEFADAACAPPTESEEPIPPGERFAQVSGAKGNVEFAADAVILTASGLLNGGRAALTATLHSGASSSPVAGFDLDIVLQDAPLPDVASVTDRRFLDGLPGPLRQFFADYVPRGRFDGELRARRARDSDALDYEGRATFREGRCRYFRFPYDFDGVEGTVSFSPRGIELRDLTGRHGSARVALDGHLNNTTSWTGFQVHIRALDVPLDEALYDALPAADRRIWDEADPRGLADLDIVLRREDGSEQAGPPDAEIHVDAELRGGSVALGDARRLSHAHGHITIAGPTTTIHELRGFLDAASVALEGEIHQPRDGQRPEVALRVRGDGVAIGHGVALADSGVSVRFDGSGEVWGRVARDSSGRRDDQYVVRVADGSLATPSAEPWSNVKGWLIHNGDELVVRDMSAQRGREWVELSGRLIDNAAGTAGGSAAPAELSIRAGEVDFERAAAEWLPDAWRDAGRRLGVRGAGRVSVQLAPRSEEPGPSRPVADVRIEAPLVRPVDLPLDFRDVSASLSIDAARCQVHLAAGRVGEAGAVRAAGLVDWTPGGASARMSLSAHSLELGTDLIRALPGGLRDLLFRLAAAGQLDVELAELAYDGADESWRVAGGVRLRGARFEAGAPFQDCSGQITGQVAVARDGGLSLDAGFNIDAGTLHGRPIARWEGRLRRASGDDSLLVSDVRGRFCDGEMIGSARYDTRGGGYEVSMTLSDVDFSRFLNASPDDLDAGRLDGYLFLRADRGDAPRTGGGNIRVRGGSFMRTPLLTGVLREARRGGDVADVVRSADAQFVWEGDVIHLTRVDVQSRDLRLVGRGDWNMRDGSIDLALVGAHPRHWPRVAVLTDLLESAGREFAQYRVTGPARDPRVSMEPLHNLTEPLRKLLAP